MMKTILEKKMNLQGSCFFFLKNNHALVRVTSSYTFSICSKKVYVETINFLHGFHIHFL